MHVVLKGNPTEGFKVYGPYVDFDAAACTELGTDTWIMEVEANDEVHVTRVTAMGDVYGHDTTCCHKSGCNAVEHYYPRLRGATHKGDGGCHKGDRIYSNQG